MKKNYFVDQWKCNFFLFAFLLACQDCKMYHGSSTMSLTMSVIIVTVHSFPYFLLLQLCITRKF